MTGDAVTVLTEAVQVWELTRVLRALEDAGAAPVVFKGAALAHTHYSESWRRPRYDADLLIAPESRVPVFAILRSLGYERRVFVSGDLVMYQAPFERVDHLGIEHALDIHWRIANPQVVSQVLTHDELLERSVTVRVQEAPMRVLSSVDALLVACVHRVAHHPDFEKPIWIQDIHLRSGFIQRWLGLANLEIQTASGSATAELVIEGFKEYEAIRDFLYTRMRGYQTRQSPANVVATSTAAGAAGGSEEMVSLLLGIRDELRRTRELLEATKSTPPSTPSSHV